MSTSQVAELNHKIETANKSVFNLLSQKGREIFFPKDGILVQTAEAKNTKHNATIGIAINDEGGCMHLKSAANLVNLPPDEVFPYAPSFGETELRKLWQELIQKKNPSLQNQISLPVVTCGLTHGLSMAGYMFLNEGDEILIPDKFWGNYKLIFENAFGAKLKPFNTFSESGFDLEALRIALNSGESKKKILLLNFPNNPTGYTPTTSEAHEIAKIIKESADSGKEILAILDDAYFGLVFKEGIFEQSLFALLSNIHPSVLALKIDGTTKEDYSWGFRLSFVTFAWQGMTKEIAECLEEKFAGAIRGNLSNAPKISQSLAIHAIKSPTYFQEKLEKYEIMKERFDEVCRILENQEFSKFFEPVPFNSGYFMCLKLKNNLDPEKVRQLLISKYSIGTIATSGLLRIAFSAVGKDALAEVFQGIADACAELS
jgi:aspartate/methionine/tyrosine aminotransferase